MDELNRTAYHEAGHFAKAIEVNVHSVDSCRVTEIDGNVQGGLVPNHDLFDELCSHWLSVAIAGPLAEARAASRENSTNNTPKDLEINLDTLELLEDTITGGFYRTIEDAFEIVVKFVDGSDETSNFTRSDIKLIPQSYRTGKHVEAAFIGVVRFLNDPSSWRVVEKAAQRLLAGETLKGGQFRLFDMMGDQ